MRQTARAERRPFVSALPERDDPSCEGRVIWLARHAARLDFEDPRWRATASRPDDPPLSASGRAEAEALAERLSAERIDALFSSPFLRCVETAAFVAGALDLPIRIEPGLSEWLNRDWFPEAPEILGLAELARRFPRVDVSYRPRGAARYGESAAGALRRAGLAARRLAEEFAGTLLMVGHGASLQGGAAGLLGIDAQTAAETPPLPDLPSACLVQLVRAGDRWTLALRADTSHLTRLAAPTPPDGSA